MGIAATLLIYAAVMAQPGPLEQSDFSAALTVQARAGARIMAGAELRFDRKAVTIGVISQAQPQFRHDNDGILWAEFS